MSNWQPFDSGDWTVAAGLVAGHGGGVGEFRTSYAVDLDVAPMLNGRVAADLRLLDQHGAGVGLVCRADRSWNFVAFYTAPEQAGSEETFARIGVWLDGVFNPVATLSDPVLLGRGFNRFSLDFFSGRIRGEIRTGDRVHELLAPCPHIPFAGHVGLVKLYGSSVLARNVEAERTLMPFVAPARPASGQQFVYDVFLCYSRKDVEDVHAVAEALKQHGVTYWLDSEQIDFGDDVIPGIEAGLRGSRYVVPCISGNLSKSGWTRAEFSAALNSELSGDASRVVIPLMLPGAEVADLPLLFRDKRRASYANKVEFGEFIEFLRRR